MNHLTTNTNDLLLEGADHPKHKRHRWFLSIHCTSCPLGGCHQLAKMVSKSNPTEVLLCPRQPAKFWLPCRLLIQSQWSLGHCMKIVKDSSPFLDSTVSGCVFWTSGYFSPLTEPMAYGPRQQAEEAECRDSLRSGDKPNLCSPYLRMGSCTSQ